jgi:NAD(P)-dependent dehydrogenase (short-subunit alcohol dehydrogenase family)
MRYFDNKTVIVTGSGKGIGKTTAFAFLAAGANVVINARTRETLDATSQEFEDNGFHPLTVVADVSKVNDCKLLVQSAMDRFGRIDILINNAGVSMRGRFEDLSPEVFPKIVTGNLLTAVYATQSALPEIIKTKGSIVFISSLVALHGMPILSPYSAAKAGVDAFAESLRVELDRYGIHVGILHVGLVRTYPGKKVPGHNGSLIPVIRKGHQSEEDVARSVLRMVRRRRSVMTLTLIGRLMYFLEKVSPSLVYWCLRLTQDSVRYK